MKKLILVLLLGVIVSFASSAQVTMRSTVYAANSLDTVTNTATKTLIGSKIGGLTKVGLVQFTATKISGTIAGTATLQGSVDGLNWYTIGSAFTLTDVASQTTSFKVTDVGEQYFQVSVTGTGTMSAQIKAKYITR